MGFLYIADVYRKTSKFRMESELMSLFINRHPYLFTAVVGGTLGTLAYHWGYLSSIESNLYTRLYEDIRSKLFNELFKNLSSELFTKLSNDLKDSLPNVCRDRFFKDVSSELYDCTHKCKHGNIEIVHACMQVCLENLIENR